METFCGIDCGKCHVRDSCRGCIATGGRPFSSAGKCPLAACCQERGQERCDECGVCGLKAQLMREFNALKIPDMEEVKDLHILLGSYINLEYAFPSGPVQFWDDGQIYFGNQLRKKGSHRCYGLTADEKYLLVCEYGQDGADPEIIILKKRSVAE